MNGHGKKRSTQRSANAKKGTGAGSSKAKSSRLDDFVEAQKDAVGRFSEFAEQVADMTMKGSYKPSEWVRAYGTLWRNVAKDMANLTKVFFKD